MMLHSTHRFAGLALALGLVLFGPSLALAQESATSGSAPQAARKVREAILARFRVLPVQNGVVLVPLSRVEGVDNIELRDGTIAINGHAATGGEVRQRLGRDADSVLELSYFDSAELRRMLVPAEAPASGSAPPPAVETPTPAPPEPSEPPALEEPGRSFRRQVETRVRVGGNITVDADEQVNGPVVAVFGSVTVNGRVRDNVVAVGGNVRLGPDADVRGDVTAVGGEIDRAAGARVSGKISEVAFSVPPIRVRPYWDSRWLPWFDAGPWRAVRLLGSLLRMAVFTLLAAILLLLVPRAVERVETAARTQPWKALVVGLLAQLFFVPLLVVVVVVLAISIIGIPLLVMVPFGVLAFFVALMLGFTGAAMATARLLQRRFTWAPPAAFSALLVGLVAIWGLTVLGRVVSLGGGPLAVVGAAIVFTGFAIEYAAWTVGLGGAVLTRFGRRGALPSAIPPIPAPAADAPFDDPLPPLT
jgi:hypothetical protein